MPGKAFTALMGVAVDQHGYVTTDDARTVGVAPEVLRVLAHRGDADHVAHGVYRMRLVPSGPHDRLMAATLWPRGRGVISHDTALDLWELCDVNPGKIHVTVPADLRIRRRTPAVYAVHKRDLDPATLTWLEGIRVVTVRRAILDGINRHLGGHLIDQAMETGRATGQLHAADIDEINRARSDG